MLLDTRPHAPFDREPQPGGGAVGAVFYLGPKDSKRLTWEHLETVRLKKLGLPNRYSRHLNRDLTFLQPGQSKSPERTSRMPVRGPSKSELAPTDISRSTSSGNSLAPFYTMAKPTCGFFFSCEADNKKRKFGIPSSDLVKWRSFTQ